MNDKINNKTYKNLPPFKGWVLENFPFIEADFDCITNYQLMCKITEYLNNILYNMNQVEDLGAELVNGYNSLLDYVNNYFNNLDVTEEVNNKLDEMAEDGTLANLLNKAISQKVQVSTLGIEAGTLTEEDVDTINNYIVNNPYCSIEFGKGTYILPKSIILLQGSSISGIGNDTILKSSSGVWAIIIKGLSSINSITKVYNLTIDGNFEGNGIYIDTSRYSRCDIHDIFIVSCINGLRSATPTVANVYDDNYTTGTGGNNLHDFYIFGETPNDDTSRCNDGLVIYSHDNFISNVRVSGYGNYGTLINGSGNQFSNFKSAVNHIGIKMTGSQNTGSICGEESFQNNVELLYVRNSDLNIKTSAAGCIVSDSLPTQLQYYDVSMINCSQNNIRINGVIANSFTYRKAGELATLLLNDSILNNIELYYGNSQVPNEYALPIISNCAFANSIKINNNNYDKFISYNILDSISTIQAGNTTLSGDYPNLTVQNSGTSVNQNFFGLDLTDIYDHNLIIFDKCFKTYPPQYLQISYKFSEESSAHNYQSSLQFISSYGQNGGFLSNINVKSVLETQADYINAIQLGYTIQYVRIYLRCAHAVQGISNHEVIIADLTE